MKTLVGLFVLLLLSLLAAPANACPPVAIASLSVRSFASHAHCDDAVVSDLSAFGFAQGSVAIQAVPFAAIVVQDSHCAVARVNRFALRERRFRLREFLPRTVFRQSVVIRAQHVQTNTLQRNH